MTMKEVDALKLIIQHKDETIKILSDLLQKALKPQEAQGWTTTTNPWITNTVVGSTINKATYGDSIATWSDNTLKNFGFLCEGIQPAKSYDGVLDS